MGKQMLEKKRQSSGMTYDEENLNQEVEKILNRPSTYVLKDMVGPPKIPPVPVAIK